MKTLFNIFIMCTYLYICMCVRVYKECDFIPQYYYARKLYYALFPALDTHLSL